MVASDRELHLAMGALDTDLPTALTVLFSVKESVFKALHGIVGRYFDYHAATVDRLEAGSRGFEVQLAHGLGDSLHEGTRLAGRFLIEAPLVHTGLMLPSAHEHQRAGDGA